MKLRLFVVVAITVLASAFAKADARELYVKPFDMTRASNFSLSWVKTNSFAGRTYYDLSVTAHITGYGHWSEQALVEILGTTNGVPQITLVDMFDENQIDPGFAMGEDQDVTFKVPYPASSSDTKFIDVVVDEHAPTVRLTVPPQPADAN